jgi:hypothetical protein
MGSFACLSEIYAASAVQMQMNAQEQKTYKLINGQ